MNNTFINLKSFSELSCDWCVLMLMNNNGTNAMRTFFLTAALLSASIPSLAMAQQTCEQHSNNRVIGTVAGAGLGGVLGNIIAGGGDKTLGTVLGAVGGGVIGNQVSKGRTGDVNCARAYGFYDQSGAWHASNVQANAQAGYYDREGSWIEGAPRGYYDSQNRWVSANGSTQVGYRDGNGRWVVPSANDFDQNNRYRVGMVNGYWQNGRWIAGETTGSYDQYGRWIAGAPNGRRDNNGNWIANEQPGYYDRYGRWHAGSTSGSYDARGVWIAANTGYGNGAYNNGNNAYGNGDNGQRDIQSRFMRIEQRISRGVDDGSLNRNEAQRDQYELSSIRRYDRSLRNRNGAISARNEARVQQRLDRLSDRLRDDRNNR